MTPSLLSRRPLSTASRLAAAVTVALAGIAGIAAAPLAQGAPSTRSAPASAVAWSGCYRWLGDNVPPGEPPIIYECATVPVPLDHDDPRGASVLISVVRIPASDRAHRIGSLFLNPGGPGGSGVDFALFAGPYLYTPELRARFDIVGFDPRGIARSTQLRCTGSPRQQGPWFVPLVWPESAAETDAWALSDAALQEDCDQRGGRILDHMSTADVARDLDLLRAAVGDEQLTYAGYSYGSYLGVTYANLFPSRVRALVVDGVLDPVAWSTGDPGQQVEPFSTRLRSDVGSRDTLAEFFRLCDEAGDGCPFAAPGGSSARYDALEARLRAHPVDLDGFAYDHRFLVGDTLGFLYSSPEWWTLADLLATLDELSAGGSASQRAAFEEKRRSVGSGHSGFPRYPGYEGFAAVACADSDNPTSVAAWSAAAADRALVSRFGPLWSWVSSVCNDWPGSQQDRFVGPWTARTANPVLVASTRFDPATPLHGAQRVAGLLPGSRLLTVEGWGHTTLFLSAAADAAVAAYLLDGTLPAVGARFSQDLDPLAPPAAADARGAGAAASASTLRATHLMSLRGAPYGR